MRPQSVVIYNTTFLRNKYLPILYLDHPSIERKENLIRLEAKIPFHIPFSEDDLTSALNKFINNTYIFSFDYSLLAPHEDIKIKINETRVLNTEETNYEKVIFDVELLGEIEELQ